MDKELCQICHQRIAEHRFTRVIDGAETYYRICSHCRAVMDNKYRELKAIAARRAIPPEQRRCPGCGLTLAEFNASGMLGCDRCYETFDDYLSEYIRSYHGANTHVGMNAAPPPPIDVEDLYKELEILLAKKDYAGAAKVKEKISKIWGDVE